MSPWYLVVGYADQQVLTTTILFDSTRDASEAQSSVLSDSSHSLSERRPDREIAQNDGTERMQEFEPLINQQSAPPSRFGCALSTTEQVIVDGDLQNPGDALKLLARVASDHDNGTGGFAAVQDPAAGSPEQLPAGEESMASGDLSEPVLPGLDMSLSTARALLIRSTSRCEARVCFANLVQIP